MTGAALPAPELLRIAPLAYAVRIALLELGYQWRAERQWDAWLARS